MPNRGNAYTSMPNSSSVPPNIPPRIPPRLSTNTATKNWGLKYEELLLGTLIGEGSFGKVYRAQYRSGQVAVKILPSDLTSTQYENFMNEIQLMGSIRPHPNVVQFQGFCIHEKEILLVTELCSGGSLFDMIHSNRLIPKVQVLSVLNGIANGMQHLHLEGIIHRDLAARNVVLTSTMEVKVTDFGMSRFAGNEGKEGIHTYSQVGPLKWMSPELLSDRMYSIKSDVWSFGIVIYEVTFRKVPYGDLTPVQVSIQVAQNKLFLPLPKG